MSSVPIVSVIDDDVSVLKGLARLCRAWGFTVRPFTSGQQFLEHVRSENDEIGCVVLDVHLPDCCVPSNTRSSGGKPRSRRDRRRKDDQSF